jgi:predicted dehydrogenase
MLEILRATRGTGIPVCVGHNRRSSRAILDLKRLCTRAASCDHVMPPSVDRCGVNTHPPLPDPRQVHILMRVNDDRRSWKPWIFSDEQGILFAEMVHFVDVALWLTPSPPVRVFAEGSPRGNFALVIRFADGSLTTIQHTMIGHFDYPKELIEVSLNHVTLAMEHHVELRQRGLPDEPFRVTYPFSTPDGCQDAGGIEGYHRAVTAAFEQADRTGEPPAFVSPDKGHANHLDRFLDCIEGTGPNPCDVEGAIDVTRVTLKLLESIHLGQPVSVDPQELIVSLDS